MAAHAALRVGAGLVSVATHSSHAGLLSIQCPEIMSHGITTLNELNKLLERASVIVLGPGLGQSEWSRMLWQQVIHQSQPLIVDADGLNLLAEQPMKKDQWILTPHPKEAARLLQSTVDAVQADRIGAAQRIQSKYGGICILKGAGTLICAENAMIARCDQGNPGMASAGMVDILSGVLGGLIAQQIPMISAAKYGVYIHAVAGDTASTAGERGTMATDLLPHLRHLVNMA